MSTHFRTLAIAVALPLALAVAPAQAEPRVGDAAPEFTGTDSNGNTQKLSDLKGKTVILEWTNHLCPYVGKHYGAGNMQALQKDATKDGIVWLSVISSAPGLQGHVAADKANALTGERDAAPSAIILDEKGEIGKAYNARTTPHMYIINPEGTLVYKGAIDDTPSSNPDDIPKSRNYVRDALAALNAGKQPDPSSTRAYGCSVKYGS